MVHLIVVGLFDSKSYGTCVLLPTVGGSTMPFGGRRVEWKGACCALQIGLSGPPCGGRRRGHSPLVKSQPQGSKGLGGTLRPSYSWVLQALRDPGKVRTHWPHKTQSLFFTEGHPGSLRVLVAGSRHRVQWDLLEGNLVLTPPPVRFIGRKPGAHRINRRQKERAWKSSRPREPSRGALEQPGQDVRHHCRLAHINPDCPLHFASWLQRESPH